MPISVQSSPSGVAHPAPSSTVPDFMDWLLAQMQAHPTFDGVQVEYSYPGDAIGEEAVYFGNVKTLQPVEYPVFRPDRVVRQENYSVQVMFDVASSGPTSRDSKVRAFQLFAGLEDILASNPSAGGMVIRAMPETWDCRSVMVTEMRGGWASILVVDVGVHARVQ